MKVRHVLIIISSLLMIIIVIAAFSIGRMVGVSYGEANAEEIRKNQEEANKGGELSAILFSELDSSKMNVVAKAMFNQEKPITAVGFGQVVSSSMINITSEVQGKINSAIALKKGTKFKKGQLLFTIQNDDVKMALKARKSAYLTIITNILPDLKLDYPENFEVWLTFYNKLDVSKPLPPLPQTKSFQEKNFIVSRNVLTEYYSIESEEERLKKYTIVAPFTGSVLNTFTDDGAITSPGSPVLAVIREGNLEIEVPIKNAEIDLVKLNADVVLFDEGTGTASGKVIRKGTFVNPNTQTVPVFIEIDSSEIDLYNGMYLNASIACDGIEKVMELPRKAIFNKNEVYVVKDGKIYAEPIAIKMFLESSVLAKDIPDGTEIVLEPLINAKDGLEVSVINKETTK